MDGKNDEIKFAVFIGTAIMFAFSVGLFFLVISYKNSFFRMKKREAELLLKASLESEKKERQRIATDLHDSVSSDLSAIRNFLAVIIKQEINSDKLEIFNDLKIGVEKAIENTRLVSYKLMPPLLDTYGLEVALEEFFKIINRKSHIPFVFRCEPIAMPFSSLTSYELYRIVQEFVTNMLKYGETTNCQITLKKNRNKAELYIENDGLSYDFYEELKKSKGLGLKNIESRVKVIDGKLVQFAKQNGNKICISLQLN